MAALIAAVSMTGARRAFVWVGVLLAVVLPMLAAAAQGFREYDVKAVFLFNFAQFVEWPATAFPSSGTPFVIGILGEDPFGTTLDETVSGETLNGRPFVVRRFRRVEDIDTCHILFVSGSETAQLEQTMATLQGRNILTVGDADEFVQAGGVIGLVTANNRIRLRINIDAARLGMLTISSKLLRPAEIVSSRGG